MKNINIREERYNLLRWLVESGAFTDDYIAHMLELSFKNHIENWEKVLNKLNK